jgi:hypothetical protein
MKTEMGEYIAGCYLKLIEKCDVVDYNIRFPGGGLMGLNELDVVGLRFSDRTAFVCEVTTHIRGVLYKNNSTTVKKIAEKHRVQKKYAAKHLNLFRNKTYMFWSPVVPKGYITSHLAKIRDLELIINDKYASCVDELLAEARQLTHDVGNPFFRALQILEHLRREKQVAE